MKLATKINFKTIFINLAIPLLCGFIGVMVGLYVARPKPITQSERIGNFYEDEMATVVSPTTLKKMIDGKDQSYILVDLRSAAEYNTEHFVTAINIPAVSMNSDQIVNAFKALPKNKEIIVHCYSAYCTLGRQVGKLLAEHGIFVKELDTGWSELRYHWDLWNPGANVTDGASYIIKGSGTPSSSTNPSTPAPCVIGQYGC